MLGRQAAEPRESELARRRIGYVKNTSVPTPIQARTMPASAARLARLVAMIAETCSFQVRSALRLPPEPHVPTLVWRDERARGGAMTQTPGPPGRG